MMHSNAFADVIVLIPAYNPDDNLVALADELMDRGCERIVIVDDGSARRHRTIFDVFDQYNTVHICRHSTNQGKGAALKTGLRFVQECAVPPRGVITADADGQHLVKDIQRLAEIAMQKSDDVLLGCREFGKATPFRSLLGNRLTAFLMAFVHGITLTDTQTGLRYLPLSLVPQLVALSGKHYEFELQCLITASDSGYSINQVPVSSVYIDGNASSHFMPIVDSIRIYSILLRFGGSSIFCFGIDIFLFTLIYWSGTSVMFATISARIISGMTNFWINKSVVFARRNSVSTFKAALHYLALWLVLMLISGTLVTAAAQAAITFVVLFKILVDVSLFLLSYYIQSRFVFAANHRPNVLG